MLQSMTGYGKANFEDDFLVLNIELRSLNSKYFEANLRLPKELYSKEIPYRKLIQKSLVRGKLNAMIELQCKDDLGLKIDEERFTAYYSKLKSLAQQVEASQNDLFRICLHHFDQQNSTSKDFEQYDQIFEETLQKAIDHLLAFRAQEGLSTLTQLQECIEVIKQKLDQIESYDPSRQAQIRKRIDQKMDEIRNDEKFDANRFEQEMIYYLEKIDITEEKVRLTNHLKYFNEMLNNDQSNGKKLAFIGQEIGREINTIGSKANDHQIQRWVVEMKDELEKIKEQTLNIV